MISKHRLGLFILPFILGLAHLLQFPLDFALVLLLSLLQLSLQLFKPVLLLEVCDFEVFVPLVFFQQLLHLLRSLNLSILEVEQLAELQVVPVGFLVSFFQLLDSLLLLLYLILLLSMLDVATQ
jgi:hypothetical protein